MDDSMKKSDATKTPLLRHIKRVGYSKQDFRETVEFLGMEIAGDYESTVGYRSFFQKFPNDTLFWKFI